MRAYAAFTKKEFTESVRTYKLFIVAVVFLLFGMMNPIIAKITPDMLSAFMPEGMTITLPTPGAIDSWTQFYKNMQMQLILFVIVFGGVVANELSRGTLVNMLTKGLSRKAVILSKFTAVSCIWTASYLLCFAVTYGYTLYMLPGELPNVFFAAFCTWIFGILLISVMIFGGVLFSNIYGALLTAGGFAVFLTVLNVIPKLERFNPILLSGGNLSLLTSELSVYDCCIAAAVSLAATVLFIAGSIFLFDKKQI